MADIRLDIDPLLVLCKLTRILPLDIKKDDSKKIDRIAREAEACQRFAKGRHFV